MKRTFHFIVPRRTSTYGSNLRKFWTLSSIIVITVLIFEAQINALGQGDVWLLKLVASFAVMWSVLFFALVVVTIPFLTSDKFRPNPIRLFFDGVVSITLSIFGFALSYRALGIVGPDASTVTETSDFIYFSAVTFSTLGFGDFRPHADARILAAFQAILGNLHLGVIVGAAFFAAQTSRSEKVSVGDPPDDNE